jgi:cell fate (sporulation/competence/biofilm development) regulator YmcA (YheA/YmcA/DUF963 family)
MKAIPTNESCNEYDYSDDSFEEFEEIPEITEDLPTAQTQAPPVTYQKFKAAPEIDQYSQPLASVKSEFSAVDIIDTFILSQIDHLNQLKQIAIQRTINK